MNYSGTVGGALEGVLLGVPSIAISQHRVGRDVQAGRGSGQAAAAATRGTLARLGIERRQILGVLLGSPPDLAALEGFGLLERGVGVDDGPPHVGDGTVVVAETFLGLFEVSLNDVDERVDRHDGTSIE